MKGRTDLWAALRLLKKNRVITSQEFKTYRGQILAGEEDAAIKGLKRKGLIEWQNNHPERREDELHHYTEKRQGLSDVLRQL